MAAQPSASADRRARAECWQTRMGVTERIRTELLRALEARDADALEDAITSAWRAGLPSELAEHMAAALLLPWHERHEDLASALQRIRDPRTVDALFEAASARHAYLEYAILRSRSEVCVGPRGHWHSRSQGTSPGTCSWREYDDRRVCPEAMCCPTRRVVMTQDAHTRATD